MSPKLEHKYPKEWEQSQLEKYKRILEVDIAKLLRESSVEYNFLELRDKVDVVRDYVNKLAQNYDFWKQLTETRRQSVNSGLGDMITQFQQMLDFDPKQNDAWNMRNNVIDNFNNRYNGFYDTVINPLNGYLGAKAYSAELTSEFGKEAKKELDAIRSINSQIQNIQKSVLEAASTAGDVASSAQGVSFAEQAHEHKESANLWMKIMIGGGIFTLLVALFVIRDIVLELTDSNESFTANSEAYITKLVLLTFLFVGLRFIIRMYSAHTHLYVINKQRANILSSMEAFRKSAIDEPAKDTILLAAVGAAFAHQETGFITTKEGAGTDDGDIMEVVKSALRK